MKRLLLALACAAFVPTSALAQDVVEYYGVDAVGSVRIVFDTSGAVTSRTDYGPFGEQLAPSTLGAKSYAQLFRDGEAGLDYAEARTYQSRTGRFSTPDSIYSALGHPQKWNRYQYAVSNPLSFVDPSGLDAVCATDFCEEVKGTGSKAKPIYIPPKGPKFEIVWLLPGGERIPTADDSDDTDGGGGGFGGLIGAILGSLIPGAGEAMDGAVILDPDATLLEMTGAGISLGASVATGGLTPNFGVIRGLRAGRESTLVIGKLNDLKGLGPTERSLVNRLPNQGSPGANWKQNSGVLRQEMSFGQPIRDASVNADGALINNTGFLRAERDLLLSRGWTYNPRTQMWYPPR